MHYFQQIIINNEESLKKLLTSAGEESDDLVKKILFKRHVEIVNLELSYLCNRKCDYCPVRGSDRNRTQELIEVDLFQKVINELASIRYENRISLNLYNEPLLDPTLYEKISEVRTKLPWCTISFNSNGDHLNREVLQNLSDSGLNFINVTLHPQANKSQSFETIQFRINKMLNKIGFNDSSQYANLDYIKTNTFLSIRICGLTLRIQWPNYNKDGTYRGGKVLVSTMALCERTAPCSKPFREFTIFSDGDVVPCCEVFHDKVNSDLVMGKIRNNSIFEIYSSAILARFRKHVFTFGPKKGVCSQCSVADYSTDKESKERAEIINNIDL
ncbi:radical SAM/SPASM domain-containing protein [Pectobacterium versatile]|uniref:radical SAM/SPASM domain-containing protein n=1 Tax=Pectobacterium versatile TaxID=2488639 RepID=UPI00102F14DD|nr:radical SAM/SPASM domain-containing protein [Pectobacterium versatile]MBN3196854.1 SPASM domain-containing protein [Pectobacterium versatile]TAI98562.1 radical SAM protein [Pectobacterium versatile]